MKELHSLPRTPQRHSGFGYPAESDKDCATDDSVGNIILSLWHFNCSPHGFDLRPSEWRVKLRDLGFTEDQLLKHYPWKPTGFTHTQSALAKLIDLDAKLTDYGREQIKSHPRSGLLT